MNSRQLVFSGFIVLLPNLANYASAEALNPNLNPTAAVALGATGLSEHLRITDFATLETISDPSSVTRATAPDADTRLRLAGWLLGPSLLAMATVARRRTSHRKPG